MSRPAGYNRGSNGGNGLLWFGLLGGGVAWSLHLVVSYLMAETACLTALGGLELLGLPATTVLLMAVTLLTGLLALAATLAAMRSWLRWRRETEHSAAAYVGLTGLLLSGAFVFIIVAESLPVLLMGPGCL